MIEVVLMKMQTTALDKGWARKIAEENLGRRKMESQVTRGGTANPENLTRTRRE